MPELPQFRRGASGQLRNAYGGTSFTVPIPSTARQLDLGNVSVLEGLNLTHVFVCTPPTERQFLRYYLSLPSHPIVHVEKPLSILPVGESTEVTLNDRLSVGYLYAHALTKATIDVAWDFLDVCMIEPLPPEGNWRYGHGVTWDLGVHVVSVLAAADRALAGKVEVNNRSELVVKGIGWRIRAAWSDAEASRFTINGQQCDWYPLFAHQFLSINNPEVRARSRYIAEVTERAVAKWSGYDLRRRIYR